MTNLSKFFLLAALLLLQACTATPVRDWPAQEGRVLDAQTGQPIEGAFVVMRWIGYGGYSQSQCFHVDVAETDAQGRFHIPEWRNDQRSATLVDQLRNVDVVHKPGYRLAERTYREQSQKQGVWYLHADRRSVEDRLEYLLHVLDVTRCGAQDKSDMSLLRLYRSLYEEGGEIAATAQEKDQVDTLRYWSTFILFDPGKPSGRDEKGRLINIDSWEDLK
ncbi:MAG: carboxypeptidase-like regulatory domain-containing protein [Pseudomonadota bacterium]